VNHPCPLLPSYVLNPISLGFDLIVFGNSFEVFFLKSSNRLPAIRDQLLDNLLQAHKTDALHLLLHRLSLRLGAAVDCSAESPSLVLVINDTKLLMPCVKCIELGISNTCDEGVCGKEWWPQDHKEMVHGHEMMIMVEMHIKGRT
jgi:hypothetical protein